MVPLPMRTRMRASRIPALSAVIALTMVVLATAFAPPVAAGLDLSKVTLKVKNITIGDMGFYGGTARCPAGTRAVGGGIMTLAANGALDATDPNNRAVIQSGPTPDGKGWFGELFVAGFSLAGTTVRITASCLDTARLTGLKVVRKDLAVRAETITFGGRATCPTGTRVLTGGATWHLAAQPGAIARGLSVALTGSAAPGQTSWYASGYPTLTPLGGDPRLRITLLCLPASRLPDITKVASDLFGLPSDPFHAATLQCPGSRRLLHSGAFTFIPNGGVGVSKSITLGGLSVRTGNRASYASATDQDPTYEVRMVAYCR